MKKLAPTQIPTIYFHDVRVGYPSGVVDGIVGIPEYTARVLASTSRQNGDIVLIPREANPHLTWVLRHYEKVGLDVSTTVMVGDYDTAMTLPGHYLLSVFIFTEEAHAVRPDARWLAAVRLHNDKNHFIGKICQMLDVPTPQTICYAGPDEVQGPPMSYPFYVKAAVSASGQRVNRCDNDADLTRALLEVDGTSLQVQEALPEGTVFLNVQYCNTDGHAVRRSVTRQLLNGNAHDGNIHPAGVDSNMVWGVTDRLDDYAVQMGIKGVWAYDVAWLPNGTVQVIECNPRFNGCTYFSNVAERLEVTAWEARNVKFYPGRFDGIDLGDLEFSEGRGIVVVNWGCAHHQKLGVFIAGTEDERAGYLREFNARFNRKKS